MTFKGFTANETFTRVPDSFFVDLLNAIDDADELKVTLYALWRIEHMESKARFLREEDFSGDQNFLNGITIRRLRSALQKAVTRGTLIEVAAQKKSPIYFMNSPRGRAAAEALKKGLIEPNDRGGSIVVPRPNIFKLYEENIGALTPLIADTLKDAEQSYSAEWIEEALSLAVKNNKRNWRYVEAILKRWKEEGHAQKQSSRNDQEDRGRSVQRKVDEFLKRK
jgi:DnaD/phage-associated family protein